MAYHTYFGQPQNGYLSQGAAMPQQPPAYAAMPQRMAPMRPMYGAPMSVIRVNGRPGADAFALGPNEEVILVDANEDVFYHKATDGAGYPTTREFEFKLKTAAASQEVVYATQDDVDVLRAEIAELKGVIAGGKQPRKTRAEVDE